MVHTENIITKKDGEKLNFEDLAYFHVNINNKVDKTRQGAGI